MAKNIRRTTCELYVTRIRNSQNNYTYEKIFKSTTINRFESHELTAIENHQKM